METWYCKTLGDGVGASAPSLRIQQLFPALYAASGQPSSDGIGLLVGNARSWEIFFPDRKRRAA